MHYKTPRINLNIQPLERFLECFPGVPVDRPGKTWFEATPASLPETMRIVSLEHAK
jgi:hypothetical protein